MTLRGNLPPTSKSERRSRVGWALPRLRKGMFSEAFFAGECLSEILVMMPVSASLPKSTGHGAGFRCLWTVGHLVACDQVTDRTNGRPVSYGPEQAGTAHSGRGWVPSVGSFFWFSIRRAGFTGDVAGKRSGLPERKHDGGFRLPWSPFSDSCRAKKRMESQRKHAS